MRSGKVPNFEAEIFRVVRETAEPAVSAGLATVDEVESKWGSPVLRLRPTNPHACELTIYPDYPTLAIGEEGVTTEMFGSKKQRLEELPRLIRAVIAGKFEWEHRQARFLWKRFTQLRGTFHTEAGPWIFTRQGGEPPASVQHRTYEPY